MAALPDSKIYQHIKQSEVPTEPALYTQRPHKRAWEKLGRINMLALVASTVAASVAVGTLAFVWYGASQAIRDDLPPALWMEILEKQWMTRTVTVSAILIRVAISTQMGFFAAVIAAIVLETTGVIVEQLARLSVIRSVNNGPQSHLINAIRSLRSGVQLGYVAVVFISFVNLVTLQFTSTLLLGDFNVVDIALGTNRDILAYGITGPPPNATNGATGSPDVFSGADEYWYRNSVIPRDLASTGLDPWRYGPSTYVRFAELAQSPSTALNYVDTGSTLRAYVPFRSPEQRSVLRNYSGPATVAESRVICVPPSITLSKVEMSSDSASLHFELGPKGSYPGLNMTNPQPSDTDHSWMFTSSYICGAPVVQNAISTSWALSMCKVYLPNGWAVNLNGTIKREEPEAYLLFNTTVGADWSRPFPWTIDSNTDAPAGVEWQQTTSGPWRNIFMNANGLDVGWNVSLCVSNSVTHDYRVEISGENHAFEPTISWKPQSRSYDTLGIRRLLGAVADPLTPRERGIYDLKLPSKQEALETLSFIPYKISDTLFSGFQMSDYHFGFNATMDQLAKEPTIIFGDSSHENALHVTHDAIFTHTLKETGNPALALQALITVLTQITYYDALPRFELSSQAEYRLASPVNIPTKWTGFTIVMVLLAAHFVMVIVATVVFVSTTKHSQLGSAWQAIAQIISNENLEDLRYMADMNDKEVRQYFNETGKDQSKAILGTSTDSGRSQVTYYRRT